MDIFITWTRLTKQLGARFNDDVNQYTELALGIIIANIREWRPLRE